MGVQTDRDSDGFVLRLGPDTKVFNCDTTGTLGMNDKRKMLRHLLATLAYRTQKALKGAPASFGEFQAGRQVRTPVDLVRHMTGVLGYAQ